MLISITVTQAGGESAALEREVDIATWGSVRALDSVLAALYDVIEDDNAAVKVDFGRGIRLALIGATRTAQSGWLPTPPDVSDDVAETIAAFLRQRPVDASGKAVA